MITLKQLVYRIAVNAKTAMLAITHAVSATLYRFCSIEAEPVLWLSTAHLDAATAQRLHELALTDASLRVGNANVYALAHGWLVHFIAHDARCAPVPDPDVHPDIHAFVQSEDTDEAMHQGSSLSNIAEYARRRGIQWVRLDKDADTVPELLAYEW